MQDCRFGSGAQGPGAMRVARAMQQLWTSFAKTGTPSADPALLSLSSSGSRDTGEQWPVWGGGGVDGAAEPVMAFGGSEVGLTSSAFKQQDCSLLHEHVHGTASRLLPWLQGLVAGLLPWLAVASWVHMGWLPSPLRRRRVESLLPPAEDLDGESSAPPLSWCWWRQASKWELWLGEQSPRPTDEVAPPNRQHTPRPTDTARPASFSTGPPPACTCAPCAGCGWCEACSRWASALLVLVTALATLLPWIAPYGGYTLAAAASLLAATLLRMRRNSGGGDDGGGGGGGGVSPQDDPTAPRAEPSSVAWEASGRDPDGRRGRGGVQWWALVVLELGLALVSVLVGLWLSQLLFVFSLASVMADSRNIVWGDHAISSWVGLLLSGLCVPLFACVPSCAVARVVCEARTSSKTEVQIALVPVGSLDSVGPP
jgi:hypothetical protein